MMFNLLIIEDEAPARRKLKRFLEELNEPVNILAELDTVETAVNFLNQSKPDLIFCDIELLDGNAFDIFRKVRVSAPVIFTTAYSQFLMDAFETNGIEYLLKPFSLERFQKAWQKFKLLRSDTALSNDIIHKVAALVESQTSVNKSFKKRITINSSKGIYFLDIADIVFFEAQSAIVAAYDRNGKKHLLTQPTLKEVEEMIDPDIFFRINRSEIVNKEHIERIERASKNILAMKLYGFETLLATSQNNTAAFREWVEK